ncbi:hypothetical protein RKE25_23180 (plasmid) [Dyella sp. BiH032]|uniref:hypothetical protein n=1 Tax=Dyella sp. BiH032 TaxID=3075430 RepID=UPI002892C32C|nr:hypothetical protein [Dyella sp. BiH032]WNL48587.1 hypothetical protein RKE25_23180 [Dyella sp. BiH032]
MGRKVDLMLLGPGGICDVCGHPAYDLHRAGSDCIRCREGIYMHRRFWHVRECPACLRVSNMQCAVCDGNGVISVPREDLNLEDLRQEWRSLVDRPGEKASAAAKLRAWWADQGA